MGPFLFRRLLLLLLPLACAPLAARAATGDPPPAAPAPPAAQDAADLEGRWRITWTRPGSWWPKDFTGPLVLRRTDGVWTASLRFEQTSGAFEPTSVQVVDGRIEAVFRAGEEGTFELKLQRSGENVTGQARWPGSIGWSPVVGTPITPAPADLPGAALRPFVTAIPAAESTVPPPDAFDARWRRAPTLSGDGRRVWMTDGRNLWTGDADHPDQAASVSKVARTLDWWGTNPAGDVIYLAAAGNLAGVRPDGGVIRLAEGLGDVEWVEPRWAEGRLIVATRKDRLRVLDVKLTGEPYTELYSHATADDVVFGADWRPRFLLDREAKHYGWGVDANLLTIQDPEGHMLGSIVRQPDWIEDTSPKPRVGTGAVNLLGGGDLVTIGSIKKSGFQAEPAGRAWGDATAMVVDPDTGALDAVAWVGERRHWEVRTADGKELPWLQERLAADVDVIQRVAKDRRWVVASWSGSQPRRYWRFDRDDRTLVELFVPGTADTRTWHTTDALALTARDGLPLAAYLTRPAGKGPWPLIVDVHGGPWSGHHAWKVDASAQAWAERGYATLRVNFRGTRGFGWALMESAEFGDDPMIHDVEDGIRWAIDAGFADPARIAMVGVSYGGYAALRFATAEQPLLKCAVAGFVRGNLTVPGGGLNIYSVKDEAWREAHSPDRFTDRLSAPVLVWNGGRDGENADNIQDFVRRAEAGGKAVAWIRFPWEEHGFSDPANWSAMRVIQDRFLGACLGGPTWAYPEDFADAELEVRAGVGLVPGLGERVR